MNTVKILIIDSDANIRSKIIDIMQGVTVGFPFLEEDFDFEIIEANSGKSGLKIIKNKEVDLLLLATRLSDIAGIEILEYINENKVDISVTMVAAQACREFAIAATDKGASGFILKPFNPQELRSSIESSTKQLYLKRMTQQMKSHGKKLRYKFLSVLSHELKSPLHAIEGYLNIMDDKIMGDKIESYDKMIKRSLDRISGMRSLIMDLLDLTQLEKTHDDKEHSDINVSEICKTAIDTIRPIAIQKNLKIRRKVEQNIIHKANQYEIEIIFNNILSNAVKYNKTNGEIFIALKRNKKNLKIKVKDTGIGIANEDMNKLFHSFSRIKNKDTKGISGTGLGLSILKQTVKSYGGSIEVKSELGIGSEFTILLPNKTNIS